MCAKTGHLVPKTPTLSVSWLSLLPSFHSLSYSVFVLLLADSYFLLFTFLSHTLCLSPHYVLLIPLYPQPLSSPLLFVSVSHTCCDDSFDLTMLGLSAWHAVHSHTWRGTEVSAG